MHRYYDVCIMFSIVFAAALKVEKLYMLTSWTVWLAVLTYLGINLKVFMGHTGQKTGWSSMLKKRWPWYSWPGNNGNTLTKLISILASRETISKWSQMDNILTWKAHIQDAYHVCWKTCTYLEDKGIPSISRKENILQQLHSTWTTAAHPGAMQTHQSAFANHIDVLAE